VGEGPSRPVQQDLPLATRRVLVYCGGGPFQKETSPDGDGSWTARGGMEHTHSQVRSVSLPVGGRPRGSGGTQASSGGIFSTEIPADHPWGILREAY